MTANELIDKLESVSIRLLGKETEQAGRAIILYRESAIMLLQQAQKIEALKKELALQRLSDFSQEIEDRESAIYATGYWKGIEYKKMRELSNEEINKLWAESHEDGIAMQQGFTTQQHYFAHLILRKASDK